MRHAVLAQLFLTSLPWRSPSRAVPPPALPSRRPSDPSPLLGTSAWAAAAARRPWRRVRVLGAARRRTARRDCNAGCSRCSAQRFVETRPGAGARVSGGWGVGSTCGVSLARWCLYMRAVRTTTDRRPGLLVCYRTLAAQIVSFAHFELHVRLAVARAPVASLWQHCDHVGDGSSRPPALPRASMQPSVPATAPMPSRS